MITKNLDYLCCLLFAFASPGSAIQIGRAGGRADKAGLPGNPPVASRAKPRAPFKGALEGLGEIKRFANENFTFDFDGLNDDDNFAVDAGVGEGEDDGRPAVLPPASFLPYVILIILISLNLYYF